MLQTFQGDTVWVTAVAVSPDGQRALSADHDGTLKLWDLTSGE
jgi:WD40 repeat protein